MPGSESPSDPPGPGPGPGLVAVPTGALLVPAVVPGAPSPVRLSLVIPTYNEARNVGELVARLVQLLDDVLAGAYELILVDDDSPDRTWELGLSLGRTYPQLRVLRRTAERGLSTAVVRGWQVARGEVLGVIDADLQHPPEIVPRLWEALVQGNDLALASRNVEGGGVSDWSLRRRLLSRGAQVMGLLVLPGVLGRVSDPMSGYFMLRRAVIADVPLSPVGYKILIEVIGRGRIARLAEVGYVFRERSEGESKVSWRIYLDYLRHLLRLRGSRVPLGRLLRFAVVGLSGLAVDMGLLYLLSDARQLGWGLTRSKLVAAEIAIVNNFVWNDLWTFRDLARAQPGLRQALRRFAKFNAICSMGLAFNVLILNLLCNGLHLDRYVANAVAVGVVTLWNFWLNLELRWRASSPS